MSAQKLRPTAMVVTGLLSLVPAWGAGHFDVDDADVLGAGACEVEAWGGRQTARGGNTQHLGPACGVGASLEVHANLDRAGGAGPHLTQWGPQIKWRYLGNDDSRLRAALEVEAQGANPRGAWSRQLLLPITWQVSEALAFNANAGMDWAAITGVRTHRWGVSAWWQARDNLALVAEANRAQRRWTTRIGSRWTLTQQVSLDVSAARPAHAGTLFMLGVTWTSAP